MEKIDINKFFENVKHIQSIEQRVNVLYLTTACNLKCTYCYEQNFREKHVSPKKLLPVHIDQFLHEIMAREAGMISTVVIMGGEPLLEYSLLCYTLKTMGAADHNWGVTITTNGTITQEYHSISDWYDDYDNMSLTFEISYDVTGQDSRIYHNGTSSREKVETFLDDLLIDDIPFAISYTIHKGNYKNLLADMVLLCEKYNPTKISLSPYCQELDDEMGDYKRFMNDFVPYAEYITEKYDIPICDLACRVCGKCDKSSFVGNAYMSPTTGLTYQDQDTEKKFDKF